MPFCNSSARIEVETTTLICKTQEINKRYRPVTMSKFKTHLLATIAIIICVTSLVGCDNGAQPKYLSLQGVMIGTTYHIKAQVSPNSRSSLEAQIEALNSQLIKEMSLFDPNSQLSRVNRNETTQITEWMAENILLADSISRLSDGAYDITVAPLVKAWGFGADRRQEHPNVDSILLFVGYRGLRVDRDFREINLIKQDERMQIDLNSIAKGFAVDRVADILDTYGSKNYLVEIGGELRMRGVNPSGKFWRVGVESPIDGNMSEGELLERRIQLHPYSPLKAMATSGNYRRFYRNEEGQKIVHTIDPTTGMSKSSSLLSATVVAPTCALADGYATMFMAAGDQRAEELAAKIEDCEVYFIYNSANTKSGDPEYREYFSDGMREMLLK